MVAGVFELLADWWLIRGVGNGRLIYLTGNDVVLLGSPVWMPLAWACVIVELGYPAIRLFDILRRPVAATLITAIGAGVTDPSRRVPHVSGNSADRAHAIADEERPVARAMGGGASFAVAIAAGYAIACLLLEAGRPV